MQSLDHAEWNARFHPSFNTVFRNTDAFDAPLSSSLEVKALIYPVSYLLDRKQFSGLVEAARSAGDDAICLSVTEGDRTQDMGMPRHWILNFWEYEEYQNLSSVGVLENALYSPQGHWGMLFSHEQHAVVGGNRPFMAKLADEFPGFDISVEEFISTWTESRERSGVDVSWIPRMFDCLYGNEQMRTLLPAELQV